MGKITMAGSLNHIVNDHGAFTMATIENMGDAHEALEECFDLIALLVDGDREKLWQACRKANAPLPQMPIFRTRAE